jgi:hypothetical protein
MSQVLKIKTFGRGRDIVDQNPTSPKTGENWGTLSLFIDEKWATRQSDKLGYYVDDGQHDSIQSPVQPPQ